jgi:hypothetical protein
MTQEFDPFADLLLSEYSGYSRCGLTLIPLVDAASHIFHGSWRMTREPRLWATVGKVCGREEQRIVPGPEM